MSDCKVSTFVHFVSVSDDTFPAPTCYQCAHCDYCDVTLLHCSTNNSMHIATMDGGRGIERGEIAEKVH